MSSSHRFATDSASRKVRFTLMGKWLESLALGILVCGFALSRLNPTGTMASSLLLGLLTLCFLIVTTVNLIFVAADIISDRKILLSGICVRGKVLYVYKGTSDSLAGSNRYFQSEGFEITYSYNGKDFRKKFNIFGRRIKLKEGDEVQVFLKAEEPNSAIVYEASPCRLIN